MRPTKRPPLRISTLSPAQVAVPEQGPITILCPTCHTWRVLRRAQGGKVIAPHRRSPRDAAERELFDLIEATGGTLPRCPDAARLITLDLTPLQWRTRLARTPRDADNRRATRVHTRPAAPTITPLYQMAG
jgi:hypothetical protein